MALTDLLARPFAAGIFVIGGLDAVRHPAKKLVAAEKVTAPIAKSTGLSAEQLVRINGGAQVAAGLALATGKLARPSALVLAATLVPTTLAAHRFWEEREPGAKATQRIQFLKNLSMLGGLLSMATNTGGRPSLPWKARRVVAGAVESSVDTVSRLIPTTH